MAAAAVFEKRVNYGRSYDVFRREFLAGGRECVLYMIDGNTDHNEIALLLTRPDLAVKILKVNFLLTFY